MVLKSKNTNLAVLAYKYTLLDSIPSSDFSIFRFYTGREVGDEGKFYYRIEQLEPFQYFRTPIKKKKVLLNF